VINIHRIRADLRSQSGAHGPAGQATVQGSAHPHASGRALRTRTAGYADNTPRHNQRMSAASTTAWLRAADESPVARLPLAGRIAAAVALILGSGCQAVSFLLAPTPADSTEWLTWIANNPGRGQLSKMFDVLAMPFLIASAAVYIMLGRKRSPRLAWIAGIALAAGLVGLAVLQGWEILSYNLVIQGVLPPASVANAVDNISSSPAAVAVMLLFFVLGFGGLLATLFSLWRSRAVPRVAVLILLLGFALDIAGRGVEGHVISFVGATWIAVTILRGGESSARTDHAQLP
jgi:hypothetical protein